MGDLRQRRGMRPARYVGCVIEAEQKWWEMLTNNGEPIAVHTAHISAIKSAILLGGGQAAVSVRAVAFRCRVAAGRPSSPRHPRPESFTRDLPGDSASVRARAPACTD